MRAYPQWHTMPVEDPGVRLSQLDSERFGIVAARCDGLTAEQLQATLEFCRSQDVQLLIARCSVEDLATVHSLGKAGFELMDTLVYYQRDLARSPVIAHDDELVRLLEAGEEDDVEAIARTSFRDYSGHYHADQRLDRDACTEVYASWARSCCEQSEPSSFVLVTSSAGAIDGFSSFRRTLQDRGELVLGAVLPRARGAGLYGRLILAGMFRLQSSGATDFVTSTHLGNWGAQATWAKIGLHPARAYHTFHRWFDRP
jgi:ribosomal protein S18 acetylase RimI-like enzyme